MRQSNRLLFAFGAAVAVLALAAVVLVFIRGNETVALLPEAEPAGVVQRYLIAVQKGDYQGSLKYVATPQERDIANGPLPLPRRLPPAPNPPSTTVSWRATLGATRVLGDQAQVDITVHVFRPGGPFGDPVQTINQTFFLVRQDNAWRIENADGLWWLY